MRIFFLMIKSLNIYTILFKSLCVELKSWLKWKFLIFQSTLWSSLECVVVFFMWIIAILHAKQKLFYFVISDVSKRYNIKVENSTELKLKTCFFMFLSPSIGKFTTHNTFPHFQSTEKFSSILFFRVDKMKNLENFVILNWKVFRRKI